MSPQAWPLPNYLTNIITSGMKTNFLPQESNGTASGSRSRDSPDVTKKKGGNEARREAESDEQDKTEQASQRARVNAPTMLPRTADRNSASSGMSNMTTQTAADIVKDTRDRLGNLGVSVHAMYHVSCSLNGRRTLRLRPVCCSSREQESFARLADQITHIAQLDEELDTAETINRCAEMVSSPPRHSHKRRTG